MSQDLWNAVDDYIGGTLVGADPALEAALASSAAAGLPAINVSPSQGKLLFLLARIHRARAILEVGTLGGYSAIWLARALPSDGGRLVTIELDPKHAKVAESNIRRAGVSDRVEIRVGAALEILPHLTDKGPFDLFFLDADKANNARYFEWALKLSRPGSVIVADNVVRDGRVVDAHSGDAAIEGTRRLYETMANEPRVSATVIQTVGSKGHDGFALALVTG